MSRNLTVPGTIELVMGGFIVISALIWQCDAQEGVTRDSARNFEELATLEREDARLKFRALASYYLSGLVENQRSDLVVEAGHWFARNAEARAFYTDFVRTTRSLLDNSQKRGRIIRELSLIPAEWSLRLLGELLLDESTPAKEGFSESEMRNYALASGGGPIINHSRACVELIGMQLAGAPASQWNRLGLREGELDAMRGWWRENAHRADEIARETWGKWAVLDRDLSGTPDDETPSESQQGTPSGKDTEPETPVNATANRWWVWATVCGLAALGIAFAISRRGAAR